MVEQIIATLVAGLIVSIKDTAAVAVSEAYQGLRRMLEQIVGSDSVARIEDNPNSEIDQDSLAKKLEEVSYKDIRTLMEKVECLTSEIKEYQNLTSGGKVLFEAYGLTSTEGGIKWKGSTANDVTARLKNLNAKKDIEIGELGPGERHEGNENGELVPQPRTAGWRLTRIAAHSRCGLLSVGMHRQRNLPPGKACSAAWYQRNPRSTNLLFRLSGR